MNFVEGVVAQWFNPLTLQLDSQVDQVLSQVQLQHLSVMTRGLGLLYFFFLTT